MDFVYILDSVVGEELTSLDYTFRLSNVPDPNTVRLYCNGERLQDGVDYILSGSNIIAIVSGSNYEVDYIPL